MADNDILLNVPQLTVAHTPMGNMRASVDDWLTTNVYNRGGLWYWTYGPLKNNIKYATFRFEDVPNSVRFKFVNEFNGFIAEVKKEELFKKINKNSFVILVPEKNITTGWLLSHETTSWLKDYVKNEGGHFTWAIGITQDDIKYSSITLNNVSDDTALLFKLTFG